MLASNLVSFYLETKFLQTYSSARLRLTSSGWTQQQAFWSSKRSRTSNQQPRRKEGTLKANVTLRRKVAIFGTSRSFRLYYTYALSKRTGFNLSSPSDRQFQPRDATSVAGPVFKGKSATVSLGNLPA